MVDVWFKTFEELTSFRNVVKLEDRLHGLLVKAKDYSPKKAVEFREEISFF